MRYKIRRERSDTFVFEKKGRRGNSFRPERLMRNWRL